MRTAPVGSKARVVLTALTGLLLATLTLSAVAQERDRTKIPDRYKWNLADIYPADTAWRAAKDKLAGELPQLGQYKGKLASSARTLADPLELTMKEMNRAMDEMEKLLTKRAIGSR